MTSNNVFVRLLARAALCLWCLAPSSLVAAGGTSTSAPATDTVITAELSQDGETLYDGQPATIFVRVTNKSDAALLVTRITPFPGTVLLSTIPTVKGGGWTIVPHGMLVQAVTLKADTALPVASGMHLIGYVIDGKQLTGAHPWSGQISVSKDVTTSVPGMTDIQKTLQLPSFLFLPGLLICVTFSLLWRLRPQPAGETVKSAFALAADPKLWVLAITLSGFVVWFYPVITARFMPAQRSILYGYDLGDVARVWVGSIGIGAVAASLALLINWSVRTHKANRIFLAGEDPHTFLQRLKRMKRTVLYPYVSKAEGQEQFRLYRLEANATATQLWAAPAIAIEVVAGRANSVDMVNLAAVARAGNVAALLAHLDVHLEAGNLTLRWKSFGEFGGPLQVDREKFNAINADRLTPVVDTG